MARYLLLAGLACFGMALLPVAPAAELYKCKGDNGETVFSDQPCAGGETLPLRETPTFEALPKPTPLPPTSAAGKPKQQVINYKLAISKPAAEEVIRDNEGRIGVEGSVSPMMDEDHRVRLLLDGKQVGELAQAPSWTLDEVDRGEHTLVIEVVHKSSGKVFASSPSSKFMLFRTSAGQTPNGAGGVPTATGYANGASWPGSGMAPQPGDPAPPAPTKPTHTGPRK
ncbi:DUF4124 domain-containing protein [Permianibacter sp. IMCC34836]|uniref:DUF4124 domain-containing protein n=1 Tax=Permianibacter fluminis TaxID=2738515 RepID=UPI0015570A77|nr:DUF4124 domain-containing protein [Permianibacter fluminis]NQD36184.1 DUF4124 domain-containing protein [Permianibacter fluminis]